MLRAIRELLVVFRVLATMRLEAALVLLKLLRVSPGGLARLNQVQKDLLEDDQEDHEQIEKVEVLLPVSKDHEASKADEAAADETLGDHAVLVIAVLTVILFFNDVLHKGGKEFCQDGHDHGIKEDTEGSPPVRSSILLEINCSNHLDRKETRSDSQGREDE